MNRHLKTGRVLLAAALTALMLGASALAARTGSITVEMKSANHGGVISGVGLDVFRVAERGDAGYTLTGPCASSGVSMSGLDTAEKQSDAAKALAVFLRENGLEGASAETGRDGGAVFAGLDEGVYLVRVTSTAGTNITVAADPFLVSIPMTDPDGKTLIYDVTADPKSNTYTGGGGHEDPDDPDPSKPPEDIPDVTPPVGGVEPPPGVTAPPETGTGTPDEGTPEEDIPEGDIPLGNLPQTGQNVVRVWAALAGGAALILAGGVQLVLGGRERRHEKD